MTGARPSCGGRKTSARSTRPSSITIGTSHSMRMPSRSSPRAAAITDFLLAADLSPAAARVSTRFHHGIAIHERGDGAEDHDEDAVEHDLLGDRPAGHRLHYVIKIGRAHV